MDPGLSEEGILIKRCRAGNMVAYSQLIQKYQDRLFNAVFRMVGNRDDALELTQETFYRAMKGLKKFRGSSGFYTWLFRIGMNLCISHHRRQQRVHMTSMHAGSDEFGHQADLLTAMARNKKQETPLQQIQLKESYHRVLDALDELEAPARAVVILRDIEQLSYSQIARILEVPVGTVKSRISRARMILREKLIDNHEPD
ncbi:MAG: sigma-70 family RNA polymerase sigma factor [Sedimentisphaerales bacterium]|nr:sigma-70 family RNA polymerase sigma factor [Sedimentisphaerales bacterium]